MDVKEVVIREYFAAFITDTDFFVIVCFIEFRAPQQGIGLRIWMPGIVFERVWFCQGCCGVLGLIVAIHVNCRRIIAPKPAGIAVH
jgi:hypothetical protein